MLIDASIWDSTYVIASYDCVKNHRKSIFARCFSVVSTCRIQLRELLRYQPSYRISVCSKLGGASYIPPSMAQFVYGAAPNEFGINVWWAPNFYPIPIGRYILNLEKISPTALRMHRMGLTSASASTQLGDTGVTAFVMSPDDEKGLLIIEIELDVPGSTEGRKKTGVTVGINVAVIGHFNGLVDGTATEGEIWRLAVVNKYGKIQDPEARDRL